MPKRAHQALAACGSSTLRLCNNKGRHRALLLRRAKRMHSYAHAHPSAQGVNLVLAANATHKWYRRNFKAYPPARRALIPFLL